MAWNKYDDTGHLLNEMSEASKKKQEEEERIEPHLHNTGEPSDVNTGHNSAVTNDKNMLTGCSKKTERKSDANSERSCAVMQA